MTGDKTYAELEMDDPLRTTALNGAAVRTSLMTSTLAFGVAALATGAGVAGIFGGAALAMGGRRR